MESHIVKCYISTVCPRWTSPRPLRTAPEPCLPPCPGRAPADGHLLAPLDPAEAPQRLARYLWQLSEIAVASLPEAERQQRQLALVNELVGLLHQLAPSAVGPGDQLHASVQFLQEICSPVAGIGAGVLPLPFFPLADGALRVNAPSEPSAGRALEAETPSANRIDLLCAFIQWNGLRLLQPARFAPGDA